MSVRVFCVLCLHLTVCFICSRVVFGSDAFLVARCLRLQCFLSLSLSDCLSVNAMTRDDCILLITVSIAGIFRVA